MPGSLLVYSHGLWRLRDELAELTGLTPKRAWLGADGCAAVAGWGHKPTAVRARRAAARAGKPYIAFEDGFLRSVRAGAAAKPLSLVMDRTGIYYDARTPSGIEVLLASEIILDEAAGNRVIAALKSHRLSKYNDAPATGMPPLDGASVLIVDQTFGDASVAGALADTARFTQMVDAALAENPGARIAVKLHPETMDGTKRGYLRDLAMRHRLVILDKPVNPWALLERIAHVYTVSSQLGVEALMAGARVTCFGAPFYAGWGATDDRIAIARRGRSRSVAGIAAAAYIDYARYFDPWRRSRIDVFTAIEHLTFLRDAYIGNTRPVVGYRIPIWKRRPLTTLLTGPGAPVSFTSGMAEARRMAAGGVAIAAWGGTANRIGPALRNDGLALTSIEDGFIRSAGLGAAFTPSVSFSIDETGIYYDPRRPSDLETLLSSFTMTPDLRARAQALRTRILDAGVTKYNIAGKSRPLAIPNGRAIVVVPGQVADDEAVRLGAPDSYLETPLAEGGVNLALLHAARARNSEAFLIYKPHPDVERLGRAGAIAPAMALKLADAIATDHPITDLFELAHRVETLTSLSGFEALLRGIAVAAHGRPFYAGWGLTDDIDPPERRGRKLDIDELVAGALILYPRYYDPISDLPCPVELALDRIEAARTMPRALRHRIGEAAGRAVIAARRWRK
ncbi:capsular polysaccharide biosynthesis protein [soil metagenome]